MERVEPSFFRTSFWPLAGYLEIEGDFADSSFIRAEHVARSSMLGLAKLVCNRGDAEPLPDVFIANVAASYSRHPAQHFHFHDY
ncbi:hypothetical protein Y032_1055g3503 [Ancylostoma ceylanicum]|uniref:Uncharacterized protein n=1 Tax=Ancylostoma ceylanicum TaxID=53326 RepID=A0A016W8V1_9BILA|nr:hypothetical protein Y032_1055g3503 [Ancylostoma ceylanicum]